MHTFGQIVEDVAPEIGTGFSSTSLKGRRYIRQAIERLIEGNSVLLYKVIKLYTVGNFLVLPHEVRRVVKYCNNGIYERPRHSYFEFIDNGPGLQSLSWVDHNVMTDRGFSPVVYQPSEELPLLLMSDRDEDDAEIHIRGRNDSDKEVRSANGTVGETFTISDKNTNVIGNLSFSTVESFAKPQTNGYLHLYSYDESTSAQYLMARYAPDDQVAAFRKYRLPGYNFDEDDAGVEGSITALAIMNQPSYRNDSDIVMIRSTLAIQMVARSIYLFNQKKYKEAKVENETGVSILKQEMALDFPQGGMPDFDGDYYMLGDVETL